MAASSLLLFSLCIGLQIFSGFADKLVLNIDCGATGTRSDSLGMKWVGDDGYINTGQTAKVNTDYQEYQTLRYFPSQKKSCYVIPGVATGRKHMVRASFFYGNYDGKSSPPSFDLQFDGNHWDRTSSDGPYHWEVIYAPKRDNISVCVAQTSPDQIPFISALVIREFKQGMYETDGTEDFLLTWRRTALGSENFVMYRDDPYDRYWHPSNSTIDGVINVTRDNMSFNNNFPDIPGLALAHAITPASSNATTLTVPSSETDLGDDTYYYNFYFYEVLEAAYQNKSRSFDFLVDGEKLNNNGSIIPPYQSSPLSQYNHVGRRLTAGSVISLVNTPDASLPPILNAMELFKLRTGLADGTSTNDVKALEELQGQYEQLQSWAGDPCLPAGSTWDWLNCSADNPPRITELHLTGSGLNGSLPDFSGLAALEIITNGNKLTEVNPSPLSNRKLMIVGVSVGMVILFLLLVGCVVNARPLSQHLRPSLNVVSENNAENHLKQQAGCIQLEQNHAFTYEEIVKITQDFEILIGNGGSGSVYYGCLNNGNEVAVKVLKDWQEQGSKEFVAEVKLLMTVNHKNLVSFIGFCDEGMNMIVLYEYMQNGSLKDILSRAELVTWKRRLQIALDVATGLDYLHSGCQPSIIHRDIKSTNILPNERLEAKVADFGISRAVEKTQISTMIVGTPGYIDPEYSEISILTKKSDVYSFGVVLFELMCGRRAIFDNIEEHCHIVEWARSKIVRGEVESIIDPRIKGQHKINSVWKVADIALACTARRSVERPNMDNILKDLNEAMEIETGYYAFDVTRTEVTTISMCSVETPISSANHPEHPIAR
ncbi:probable leucine-rich repeat receptor-like protein kinase At2g28990 [Nymphaea colorata]|nr:probable leucine-rich repeat receptor-like protein kinase At2g28990 [Nymphaea colorata]